jgi:hypothetical protein
MGVGTPNIPKNHIFPYKIIKFAFLRKKSAKLVTRLARHGKISLNGNWVKTIVYTPDLPYGERDFYVKGTVSRDFRPSVFFRQSIPPRPLINTLK